MLDAFRRHAYSRATRVFLLFIGGVFALFIGGTGLLQVKPIASVDCHTLLFVYTFPGCRTIMPNEIDREAGNIRRAVQNTRGPDAAQMLQGVNLREMAVESLIEQSVIEREAHRVGLQISDDDLEKAIESQTVFQTDGHFDPEHYATVLRDNNLEPADFESQTRGQLLDETLRNMVTSAVAVSKDQARAEYNRLAEKIAIAYIEFPYANFTGSRPTDGEIAKFYSDNKESFREPDRAKIIFIRYDPAAMASKEPPSDAAISAYYTDNAKTRFSHPERIHARHILIQVAPDASAAEKAVAKARAQDLLRKVKAGASFADLAKENSDDPGSRDNGGDLGLIPRGELVKPFEDVAFKLKPGDAALAETQFGYHVIQTLEVKGAEVEPIEEARPKIIAALKQKEGLTIARQTMEQDIAAAEIGRDLTDLAKKHGLVAVATPYFAQDEPIKGAEDYTGFAKEVFKLQAGDLRPIMSGPAPYLVKVLDRQPSHIPPPNEIKDRVADTMVRTHAETQASQAANATLKQIKSPEAFDALVATNHLNVKTTPEFVRASGEVPGLGSFPELVQAAGTVTTIPGVLNHVMEHDGNAYIVKVLSRTPPGDSDWKPVASQFTARFLEHQRQIAWNNFVSELKRKALIVVHPELIGSSTNS